MLRFYKGFCKPNVPRTDRDEHVATQADSSLSNWTASLSGSLAPDVSVDSRIILRLKVGSSGNSQGSQWKSVIFSPTESHHVISMGSRQREVPGEAIVCSAS